MVAPVMGKAERETAVRMLEHRASGRRRRTVTDKGQWSTSHGS